VITRLTIPWPDERPFADRDGRPIRFLAASDEAEPALRFPQNRAALGAIDGILGCGDLEPDWLGFLADAFNSPLVYVRGNHDRVGGWRERPLQVPTWLEAGRVDRMAGIPIVGLEWPGVDSPDNGRHPGLAWSQALRTAGRLVRSRLWGAPVLVLSHVPPVGIGDSADAYHRGFGAYRWLLRRVAPPIWLHGHTNKASVPRLVERAGPSVVANATGAVLIELLPPGEVPARSAS
jgi:hypothetical protein